MDADRIEIRGLRLVGVHGVLDEERTRAQPFEVDVDLVLPLGVAGASDTLTDTVNYADTIEQIRAVVTGSHSFQLLEAMAEAMAKMALADARVAEVTIGVRKLQPPVPADIGSVGVRITRRR